MSHQQTFRVHGTTCGSCEIVLERELKTLPGVQKVEASHARGELTMTVEDGTRYKTHDLEAVVGKHGYRFESAHVKSHVANTPFSWKRAGGVAIVILALYLVLQKTGLLVYSPSIEGGTSLAAVFVIGLVAAVSSCTAVVGGLIVAVSSANAKANEAQPLREKVRPHVLFNTGRIAGFAAFGAMVGLLGQVLTLSSAANGFLVILIALGMIGIGLNLLGVLPTNVVAPPKWLSHRVVALSESKHPGVPFVLGALTFFLPCGFTQSMQLYALTTGDPLRAALIMSVFALGTMPALLGIGVATSAAKGTSLKWMTQAAGALVVVLGISNVGNGATLLGVAWPSHPVSSGPAPIVDGAQELQMEVTEYGVYAPEAFTVVEDVPVRWEIFGSNNMGCGSTLVAPAFGVQTALRPGYNTVEFTPEEPGTYVFSCSMGMMRGTITVEPNV